MIGILGLVRMEWSSWLLRNRRTLGLVSTVAAIGWMGLIFFFSSLSGENITRQLESVTVSWVENWQSYGGHVVIYAFLGALLQTAVWGRDRRTDIRPLFCVVVVSTIYAISDEFHQSFVDGRSAAIEDGIVDSASAAVSAVALRVVLPSRSLSEGH